MPLLESEALPLDILKDRAKHLKCSCGGSLQIAWGGSIGHNGYILRCSQNIDHSDFVRPAKISNYDLPGYNMPGTIKAKEEELKRRYGEMTTNALVKQSGGNVLAVLDEVRATEIIKTIWPGAPTVEVKKAAMVCAQYGLNPLMKHLYLIPFTKRVEQNGEWVDGETTYAMVLGIKASRIIARRKGEYAYLDDTPRIMTEQEQIKIYGEVYTDSICAITRLADRKGNTAIGTGRWPKEKTVYDKKTKQRKSVPNDPQGVDKGNTKLNMAMIRSERQALDRLFPDSLPSEVTEVVDERYQDLPETVVHVSEVKPELEQLPEPANQINEKEDLEPEPQEQPGPVNQPQKQPEQQAPGSKGGPENKGKITPDQTNKLEELKKQGHNLKDLVEGFGWKIEKLSQLTESQANILIEACNKPVSK